MIESKAQEMVKVFDWFNPGCSRTYEIFDNGRVSFGFRFYNIPLGENISDILKDLFTENGWKEYRILSHDVFFRLESWIAYLDVEVQR